jgi:hypothetical protein
MGSVREFDLYASDFHRNSGLPLMRLHVAFEVFIDTDPEGATAAASGWCTDGLVKLCFGKGKERAVQSDGDQRPDDAVKCQGLDGAL